jgi:hypothetical protein
MCGKCEVRLHVSTRMCEPLCMPVCAFVRIYDGFSFSFVESGCKCNNISYLRNPRNT